MYPKYEKLKKLAAEEKYHRIPVAIEMYADATTPVEAEKTEKCEPKMLFV